jgi:hypothetical protein
MVRRNPRLIYVSHTVERKFVMTPGAGIDMALPLTLLATEPIASVPTAMSVTLRYAAVDPYAVSMVFPAGPSADVVTWTFDRELLRDGLLGAAGEGDVRLWPEAEDALTLYVELAAPAGRALLNAPIATLRAFLDATAELVAFGVESEFVDIDHELEALLGRTG